MSDVERLKRLGLDPNLVNDREAMNKAIREVGRRIKERARIRRLMQEGKLKVGDASEFPPDAPIAKLLPKKQTK